MRYKERKIRYVNTVTNSLRVLCDNVNMSLIDGDYDRVRSLLTEMQEVIDDLTKSISNEI